MGGLLRGAGRAPPTPQPSWLAQPDPSAGKHHIQTHLPQALNRLEGSILEQDAPSILPSYRSLTSYKEPALDGLPGSWLLPGLRAIRLASLSIAPRSIGGTPRSLRRCRPDPGCLPLCLHQLDAVAAVGCVRLDVARSAHREFCLLLFAFSLRLSRLLLALGLCLLGLRAGSLGQDRGEQGPGDTYDCCNQRDGGTAHGIPLNSGG